VCIGCVYLAFGLMDQSIGFDRVQALWTGPHR
jgi:hypothetical protein